MRKEDPYTFIKSREIIDILIGDKIFEVELNNKKNTVNIHMPYLSGTKLCELSTKFGLPKEYMWGSLPSRWVLMDELIDYCIENNSCSELLNYLFDRPQLKETLLEIPSSNIEVLYKNIVDELVTQINNILTFSDTKLIKTGQKFIVRFIKCDLKIQVEKLNNIDQDYISTVYEKSLIFIDDGHYDSAITQSRTLLEEVFVYGLEKKGKEPNNSGNAKKLYNQFRENYKMKTDSSIDIRINKLLSGLETVLTAIVEMRNKDSDSHGVGSRRFKIERHHALLAVNSSITFAEFLLAVIENDKQ